MRPLLQLSYREEKVDYFIIFPFSLNYTEVHYESLNGHKLCSYYGCGVLPGKMLNIIGRSDINSVKNCTSVQQSQVDP